MTSSSVPAAAPSSLVEAYCRNGVSPGRTGPVRARLEPDFGHAIDVEVGYELPGPVEAPPIVVLGGISAGRHLAPTPSTSVAGIRDGLLRFSVGIEHVYDLASAPRQVLDDAEAASCVPC